MNRGRQRRERARHAVLAVSASARSNERGGCCEDSQGPPVLRAASSAVAVEWGAGVSLSLSPITLAKANAFVEKHHRHHKPVPGAKFCIAVSDVAWIVRGVAIVGRPVARQSDDGWTLEVNRCCTDGTHNACSMLYGAAWRAAKALGYRRLITYTLPEEGGASLRASGWKLIGAAGGGSWNRPSRPRIDTAPTQEKLRWEAA